MKAFITGISGFAGSWLSRELTGRGHEVSGTDVVCESPLCRQANLLDPAALFDAVNNFRPDFIFHLAALSSVDGSDPGPVYETNVTGTVNLLRTCSALNPMPKFIFISSSQVYGIVPEINQPIDETAPVEPVNHYGASKAAAELAVKSFGMDCGLKYMILRPFNHTGPGQTDRFVVPKIVSAFRAHAGSIELGNIDTVRDFSDVRDVVSAYADSMEHFTHGEIFNICSGRGISVREIIHSLKDISGRTLTILKKDTLLRQNEINISIGSSAEIEKTLPWRRKYSIYDTLAAMLNEK